MHLKVTFQSSRKSELMNMKVNEAAEEFILEQRIRGNSPATVEYYTFVLKYFIDYAGNIETSDVTLTLCKNYCLSLIESDVRSITVQSYVRGARAFLKWLYDNELVEDDICVKFKLPKATKKVIEVLSAEEIKRVFDAITGDTWLAMRNRVIVALMLDSGLRRHEVISLKLPSVNLSDRYIVVERGKGDKQRVVPFGERSAELIEQYLKATSRYNKRDPLIIKESNDKNGYEAVTDVTIKQLFRKLKARSGVSKLRPHILRHTFATYYLENGGNIYTLQSILGHTSLEMVKRYLHLANSRIRRDFPKYSPLDNL